MSTVDGDIDALSRAIMGEAQAEIEELGGQSKSRADDILSRARDEAGQVRSQILENAKQESRRLGDQAKATSQLKARKLELEHREQLLARVFEAAAERLSGAAAKKDFGKVATELLREALDQLKTSSVVIRADQATQAMFTESELKKISNETGVQLSLGDVLQEGVGLIAQSPDGRLQFDNTLANRLDRMRAILRSDVYKILTGESS